VHGDSLLGQGSESMWTRQKEVVRIVFGAKRRTRIEVRLRD
jgi:hypothetical protein